MAHSRLARRRNPHQRMPTSHQSAFQYSERYTLLSHSESTADTARTGREKRKRCASLIHDTEAQESSSRMGEAQKAASACIEANCQETAPADIEAQFLFQKKRNSINDQRLGRARGHVGRQRGARVLILRISNAQEAAAAISRRKSP